MDRIAEAIPERRGDLRDQLRRASASIPLNLAEGAGEFSPSEKARFYRMARRSAAESAAILDLLARVDGTQDTKAPHGALAELAAMLTALVKIAENRKR